MEINKFNTHILRNEEHVAFMNFVAGYAVAANTTKKLDPWLGYFSTCVDTEKSAVDKVRTNSYTAKEDEADTQRTIRLKSFLSAVRLQTNHYDEIMADSAQQINNICESFRDLPFRSRTQKTTGIDKLINEATNFNEVLTTLNCKGWLDALIQSQDNYKTIVRLKNNERDARLSNNMIDARENTDTKFWDLVRIINANLALDPEHTFDELANQINNRITEFRNNAAIRRGRSQKDDTTNDTKTNSVSVETTDNPDSK